MNLERMNETNNARADLYETLALLTDRLNYAKRFDDAVDEKVENLKRFKRHEPVLFVAAATAVSVAVGVGTWLLARKIIRRNR